MSRDCGNCRHSSEPCSEGPCAHCTHLDSRELSDNWKPKTIRFVKCPACGGRSNPFAPVCIHCDGSGQVVQNSVWQTSDAILERVRNRAQEMCNEANRVANEIAALVPGSVAEDRLRTIASVWGQVVTLCDGGQVPDLSYKPKPDTASITTNPDGGYEVWNSATEQWEQPDDGANND